MPETAYATDLAGSEDDLVRLNRALIVFLGLAD